jgi:hypothetical protein
VLVDGHEPLDVIGDVGGGQAQQLLGTVPAVGPAGLLQAMTALQVGLQYVDEQFQGCCSGCRTSRASPRRDRPGQRR